MIVFACVVLHTKLENVFLFGFVLFLLLFMVSRTGTDKSCTKVALKKHWCCTFFLPCRKHGENLIALDLKINYSNQIPEILSKTKIFICEITCFIFNGLKWKGMAQMSWILEADKNLSYQVEILCQAVVLSPLWSVFLKLMANLKGKTNLLRG